MKKLIGVASFVLGLALLAGCSKKAAVDNSLEDLKSRGEFITATGTVYELFITGF